MIKRIKAWLINWLRDKILFDERQSLERSKVLSDECLAKYTRMVEELEELEPDIMSIMVDPGDYEPMDRYRDFVNTFTTPHGKRVMTQILIWGRVNKSIFDVQPNLMAFKEGERNLALKIVAGMTQPAKLPTEQKRRDR